MIPFVRFSIGRQCRLIDPIAGQVVFGGDLSHQFGQRRSTGLQALIQFGQNLTGEGFPRREPGRVAARDQQRAFSLDFRSGGQPIF